MNDVMTHLKRSKVEDFSLPRCSIPAVSFA